MRVQSLKSGAYEKEQTRFKVYNGHYTVDGVHLTEIEKMKILETKEFEPIEDGKHDGYIVDIDEKAERKGFLYVDFFISCDEKVKDDGELLTLKASYPANLHKKSMLGELVERLGIQLGSAGEEFDIMQLRGKPVTYMTMTQKGKDDKSYANIIRESMKAKVKTKTKD